MRIDVHSHFIDLEFTKHLQGRASMPRTVLEGGVYVVQCATGWHLPTLPNIVDMDVKLRDMEAMGIDRTVLSVSVPGPEILGGAEADDWAQHINDHLAAILADYPDKFVGFGTLGFGDPARAIAEADRCIHALGFRGIELFSNVAGKPLDAPELRPVFEHVAALGVPLNLHPGVPLNRAFIDRSTLMVPLGFLYDTSLNALRLIESGVFDTAPDLNLIVPHIGGVLPYLHGRIASYSRPSLHFTNLPQLQHPVEHYLDRLYLDTVCYHVEALEYVYRFLGPERLLLGTDHPYGDYQTAAGIVEQLHCTAAERELIYHGNAERLLRLG